MYAAAAALLAFAASAQTYPVKPVRIITGGVGGAADFAARLIANGLSAGASQPFIVENRGGVLPAETVAKAPADGHTLLLHGSTIWLTPLMQQMVSYDPIRDLAPVTLTNTSPNVLVVHPSLPVRSVKDLIALARARPGELNYAAAGSGGSSHLASELFNAMARVKIAGIQYKGTAQQMGDLLSGDVHMTFGAIAAMTPHIQSKRLRGIAVTSLEPSPLLPQLPSVSSAGVPGYEALSILGVWAPAGTPETTIVTLHAAITRVLHRPEVKEKFLATGVDAIGSTPEAFAAKIKSEMTKWEKVFRVVGIQPQ